MLPTQGPRISGIWMKNNLDEDCLQAIQVARVLVPGFYEPDTYPAGTTLVVAITGFSEGERVVVEVNGNIRSYQANAAGTIEVEVDAPKDGGDVAIVVRRGSSTTEFLLKTRVYRTIEALTSIPFSYPTRILNTMADFVYSSNHISPAQSHPFYRRDEKTTLIQDNPGIIPDDVLQDIIRSGVGLGIYTPKSTNEVSILNQQSIPNLLFSLTPKLVDLLESVFQVLFPASNTHISILPFSLNPLRWGWGNPYTSIHAFVSNSGCSDCSIYFEDEKIGQFLLREFGANRTTRSPLSGDAEEFLWSQCQTDDCYWLILYDLVEDRFIAEVIEQEQENPPKIGYYLEGYHNRFYHDNQNPGNFFSVAPVASVGMIEEWSCPVEECVKPTWPISELSHWDVQYIPNSLGVDTSSWDFVEYVKVSAHRLNLRIPVAVLRPSELGMSPHLLTNRLMTPAEAMDAGADIFLYSDNMEEVEKFVRKLLYYGTLPFLSTVLWVWEGDWSFNKNENIIPGFRITQLSPGTKIPSK